MNSRQMKKLVLHAWTKMRQSGTEILGAFGKECYWCTFFFSWRRGIPKGLINPSVSFITSSFPTVIFFPSILRTCQYILLLKQNRTALSVSLCKDLPHSDTEWNETQGMERVLMGNGWWSDKQLPCQMSCSVLTTEDKSLYNNAGKRSIQYDIFCRCFKQICSFSVGLKLVIYLQKLLIVQYLWDFEGN